MNFREGGQEMATEGRGLLRKDGKWRTSHRTLWGRSVPADVPKYLTCSRNSVASWDREERAGGEEQEVGQMGFPATSCGDFSVQVKTCLSLCSFFLPCFFFFLRNMEMYCCGSSRET